ncbi:glutamine-rich protein 2-like [Ostrinia nubilalis]|uniref:glutamine-rich protein 2-like n=1 Tax=Ostrinia nubilalis TaxID=29057 RepID=UPI0030823414
MRRDLDELTNNFYKTLEEVQAGFDAQAATPPPPAAAAAPTEAAAPPPDRKQSTHPRRSFTLITADLMNRINELEKKLNKCCDSIGKSDGAIQDQINSFQDQLEYLLKQVATLTQDLTAGKLSPDLIKDLQGLMQLFQTVQDMQEQLKQVHETALQLAAEKEDRQHNINALLEQIELLKTVKLDREDMVEAMAEKADLRMLARKVSHDQFELACDDLSRGLEHALGKLNLQEALWQQALDDIQREIEMKLDKMELSPVKDFFNSKLKQLQENLKQMASLRREAEAAGTKRKLLRDVNCISCDAKAVMPTEAASSVPISRPMPANLSMKPYLSYELDAIRKTQQTNVPQRNMHDWEAIDKQMGSGKQQPPQKARSETDKHLCNRYCGGSHTVTTPAQRVARLGHFIKQWGPDVLPLSSSLATGDDGRMYKVSGGEAANVGPGGAVDACTPKPVPSKQDKPKPPQKPMVISAECRCLDGDRPPKG